MLIRQAVLDDTPAITRIYTSNISQWVNTNQEPADYAALSLFEKWQHGGPWMAEATCAVWLGHLLQANDGIPLVAEENGEILGEAEVFIGKEPEPYGNHINISSLCVKRDQQGRGVGRALMEYIIQMAKVLRYQRLTVAYPEPVEFYKRMGFAPLMARYRVMLPAQEGRVVYKALDLTEDEPAQIQNWHMGMGRYQNGREEWERMRWYIWNGVPKLVEAEWKRLKIDLTGQPGILHLHQRDDDPTCVTVRLWSKNPLSSLLLTAVRDRVARLGYQRISTLVDEPNRGLLGEEGGQPQWLYSRSL